MDKKLCDHIDILFATAPKTPHVEDVKKNLLTKINYKYNKLLAGGHDSTAAFHIALSEIGNMDELLQECTVVSHPMPQPMSVPIRPSSRSFHVPLYLGLIVGLIILGPAFILDDVEFFFMFSCWAIAGGLFIYIIASSVMEKSWQERQRWQRQLLAQAEQYGFSKDYVQSELRSLGRTNKLHQILLVLVIILLSFFAISLVVGTVNAWHKGKPWFTGSNACVPTGPVIIQTQEIDDFDKISVASALSVEYKPSAKNLVVIETHEDILPHIVANIQDNGTLSILSRIRYRNAQKLHITVYGKNEPRLVTVKEASQWSCTEPLKTESVKFKVNGASQINIANLVGGFVDLDITGASTAHVAGKAEHVSFQMHSASKVDAPHLEADLCDVSISGASNVAMGTIHQELSVSASGASLFDYRGSPAIKKQEVSEASKVSRQ